MATLTSVTSFNVKFSQSTIDGEITQTINARDVHTDLAIGKDFSTWIKAQIKRASLEENRDYIKLTQKGELSATGQSTVEYFLTLDAAKHIALMSRSERGGEYRTYLINVEKAVKAKAPAQLAAPEVRALSTKLAIAELFEIPKHVAQIEAVKQIKTEMSVDLTPMLLLAPAQNNIADEDEMLEPSDIAKRLGHTDRGRSVNRILASVGLQERINDDWVVTQAGKKISSRHSWVSGPKSGYNYKWKWAAVRQYFETVEV